MYSIEDLRNLLREKGFSRADRMGEFWHLGTDSIEWTVGVLIGANAIVVTHKQPVRYRREFIRAANGLELAMEHIRSL